MVQEMGVELRVDQRQVPVPALMQLLGLVPLPMADIRIELESALSENPFLAQAGSPCPTCGRHLRGRRCPTCAAFGLRRPMAEMPDVADWRDRLVTDVAAELPSELRPLIGAIVLRLDERGFMTDDMTVLAGELRFPAEQVREVMMAVRTVGPPGIAATSAIHCVRLQAEALIGGGEGPALLLELIDHHLEAVASGDTAAIAADTGCTPAAVQSAVHVLRTRTRPFVASIGSPARPIEADLVIRYADDGTGGLVVDTADAAWFGLGIEAVPAGGEAWAAPFVARARVLLRQLDVRGATLRRIGEVLVGAQAQFLIEGAAAHKPLRRQDVARALDLHPSTVGRSVRDKWLRCPDGRTIPLSSCFGAAMGPMEALRRALEAHPDASDRELTTALAADGVSLARRTVAKYRSALDAKPRRRSPVRR